ncbi:MAG: FecR family protein [Bacteroidales bacterium]|nr:FecR family protein [Bacteroidales bacterium]
MQEQNKHITLILKHLSGELNNSEKKQLFDWIEESKENKSTFNEYQKAWDMSDSSIIPEIEAIDVNAEWKMFKNKVGFDDKVLIPKKIEKKKFSLLRIAAVISTIILLGIASLYVFNPKQEVLFAQNEVIETNLPDGTEISINKNSSIIYSKKFNKKERKIELKGDAYFKVEKNKTKPFIIKAESFYVEVLGTEFYVNSNFKNRKVVVTEGTVAVYQQKDKSDKVILTAGEEIIFDKKANKLRKIETFDKNCIAWKTKIFNFNNQSLNEIFKQLEKVYDVNFEFKNPQLKNCRQSVSFDNQTIDEILNVLNATFDNVKFHKKRNTIYVNGNACK